MTLGRLLSYAEIGRASRQIEALTEAGIPVVWDSGAWSVFTGAAEVDVEGHAGWVLQQPADPGVRFVALDEGRMVTSSLLGVLRENPEARAELMALHS